VFRGDPGERDAGLDSELLESVAAVSAGGVREVEPLGDLSVGLAASTAERLISAAGFAPVKAGGLNGKLLTVGRARALLAGAPLS